MKYNFEDIIGKNYIKVGSSEELFSDEDIRDFTEKREKLKKIIEPWLSAGLQTDHLSILIGSGLTTAICQIANVSSASMETFDFDEFTDRINIYANMEARKMHRGTANIEDQIRTAISLLQGFDINGDSDSCNKLGIVIDGVLQRFANNILSSETNIKRALLSDDYEVVQKALITLQSFLLTFASRTATSDRCHIFTTNYDRIVEYGCDLAGIKILDRFWGKIEPRFEQSPLSIDYYYHTPDAKNEFRYAEGVVRLSKIHGSIDWYEKEGAVYRTPLCFGAEKIELPTGTTYRDHLMIFPNSMKSVEVAFYPYSELFRDFSDAICRPNSTLFIYGYGFGDTHINKIIREMLYVPSTHVVIITYNADERLKHFLEQINMAQITLLVGPEFSSLENLVNYYLPKVAIDTLTTTASKLIDSRKSFEDSSINIEKPKEDF